MTRDCGITKTLVTAEHVLVLQRVSHSTEAAARVKVRPWPCWWSASVWPGRVTGSRRGSRRWGSTETSHPTAEPKHIPLTAAPTCLKGPITPHSRWFFIFLPFPSFTSLFDAVSAQQPHKGTWNLLWSVNRPHMKDIWCPRRVCCLDHKVLCSFAVRAHLLTLIAC